MGNPKNWVVIPAGGQGRRMGAGVAKQLLSINGLPILVATLKAFERWKSLDGVVLAVPPGTQQEMSSLLEQHGVSCVRKIVEGGAERQDSVRNALVALDFAADDDLVLIHDAVRPFFPVELLDELCAAAILNGAIFAQNSKDTVKEVVDGVIVKTHDRKRFYLAQTPQVFPFALILKAHLKAKEHGFAATDDASIVEWLGLGPRVVECGGENYKITTPHDYKMANLVAGAGMDNLRIGHGFDVHKLVTGRKLILGGVEIPHELGLLGHSDADVMAHAVADAVLGAFGMGDIGRHFPDSDPAYKGADSLVLLKEIAGKIAASGGKIMSVDVTLLAQRPKISPHAQKMAQNLADALGISADRVHVKATTTEGLGFEGRQEGISCHSVCLASR